MKVEKITTNYNFYQEKDIYYLSYGVLQKTDSTTVRFRFSNVDSKNFVISPKCGCTTAEKVIIDDTTVEADLEVTRNKDFAVTVVLINGKEDQKQIKLTGKYK